jgi:hypothetical protein
MTTTKHIISFDCGTKALGVCILAVDMQMVDMLKQARHLKTELPKLLVEIKARKNMIDILQRIKDLRVMQMYSAFYKCVNIIYVDTIDLTPGKKMSETNEYEKAGRLKGVVEMVKAKCPNYDLVLIEKQMNVNDKSRCISNQLVYAFADADTGFIGGGKTAGGTADAAVKQKIAFVGGSLKNTIAFTKELKYSVFLAKAAKRYDANKAHCRENFIHFCDQVKFKIDIKKGSIKDAADAFMMTYAYVFRVL